MIKHMPYFMLNESPGKFYKAVHCKVTRQLKKEAQMGLKTANTILRKLLFHEENY